MFGEIGEIVVGDVLGYDFPGRLAVLVDGDGSESGGCNVLDQVQPYCWTACDAESLGLRVAQVTPSTGMRECANSVCAEDACRCWSVCAVGSGRVVEKVAEKNCGGAIGRKEGIRPCGPSSGLQGNVAARCELVLNGFDCCNLEWKLYESAPWDGFVEQIRMSRGLPQGAPESPVIFTMIMELVLRDLIKSWITRKLAWRLDDFALAAMCCADDVVLVAVDVCCRSDGDRGDCKTERGRSDCWCTENTLHELPEDDGQKHQGGRTGCVAGGSIGVCGIKGVRGRTCEIRDCKQNSSSQQVSGEMETRFDVLVAPKNVAPEHCKKTQCGRLFFGVRACGRR